jgi:GrpB-like predicted nucleotidyltransferase (UPF0157 family)
MLTAKDIVTFDDAPVPAGESPWVGDHGPQTGVEIARPDPAWPPHYATLAALIREALGERVLAIEHVGSTSVPGLPAKPIIDIDLAVDDPDDEASYVPALQRCGFVLVVREWWWYGHRLMHHADPTCHLHVFAADCPENARHRIFRDWLRSHPEDRALYARAKAAAAEETNCAGGHGMDYNGRKEAVVREIYARAFHELGLTATGP